MFPGKPGVFVLNTLLETVKYSMFPGKPGVFVLNTLLETVKYSMFPGKPGVFVLNTLLETVKYSMFPGKPGVFVLKKPYVTQARRYYFLLIANPDTLISLTGKRPLYLYTSWNLNLIISSAPILLAL
jgi:hypothetical protein